MEMKLTRNLKKIYILAYNFFEKDDKFILNASVICREFLGFKYLSIVFSKQIR